jgi:hypothetical protein
MADFENDPDPYVRAIARARIPYAPTTQSSSFPTPSDNPEAGPVTNIRYRGPADPGNKTGVFYNPLEVTTTPAAPAGPLAAAASVIPSANAAGITPVTAPADEGGGPFPITRRQPTVGQPAAAAPPLGTPPNRNRMIHPAPEPATAPATQQAQPEATGAPSGNRIEQYFTPPSGPVGGPLNRGGVQVQSADGTISTQAPDIPGQPQTPQIRQQPVGPNDTVQVIDRPGGGGYIQHFDQGGYRVAKGAGETTGQAEQRSAAAQAVSQSIMGKIANGQPVPFNEWVDYHQLAGHDISKELAQVEAAKQQAERGVEAARVHAGATVGAARIHAESQPKAAIQDYDTGERDEVGRPIYKKQAVYITGAHAGEPVMAQPTAPKLPAGMKKQVGTKNGRPVYEDEKGNRFVEGG